MFGLPPSTSLSRPLPKSAVYEKFGFKNAEREAFDRDISRMTIVAWVSPKTVPAIEVGAEVQDFYVVHITMKRREYNAKHLLHLTKLIPQRMVFALQFGDETQFCVFHTRLQQSEWMPMDNAVLTLQGLSLDDVWNNLVAEIGGLDNASEETLEEQIIHREEREKLLQQIASLEKRCRAEKQTRKKYELHQQISKLKKLII